MNTHHAPGRSKQHPERWTQLSAALIAASLALTACSRGDDSAKDEIVFGLDLELTGTGSFLGKGMQAGIQAAVAKLNAAGGVGGRRIRVVARDNQSDPTRAATLVSELKRKGAGLIIGPGFAQDCAAAAQILVREDVAGLCLSAGDLPKNDTNMFGIGLDYSTMEQAIATQFATSGVKRVGLVAANDTSGDQTVATFVGGARARGIAVDVQRFNGPANDLTPQLLAVSRNRPDAIRVQATGPDALVGVANVKALGIRTPVWLPNSAASLRFAGQVKGDVGAGNIATWIPAMLAPSGTEDHPAQAAQINALRAALSGADTISAAGWDAVQIAAAAIAKADGTKTKKLITALEHGQKYFGAYAVQQITRADHRGASEEGTLLPARFTPRGGFVLKDSP
ncbi:ABC transporter substrate-binding protein [Actinomadura decatromicini]|uniref:ABC transporter substrate-binding protein n=1 Tax=Actinomadura decatromicini TaxID=2604572 RepID=A0A5D3FRI5_9ACTN|nr:ABC transporter substrate-binding protein [Actinomadura decatromicini]TYK51417.1 ABC transporter substrate-binding protein [Actinomadura decatromicini]